ncbi:MAG: 5-methyltetrahydropteroyltriglutamate--homocysteine S-methyltransferase [Candidatus Binataceae bacterium]
MPAQVRLGPPFRAEHIGSLLRPRELKDAFTARARGDIADIDFRALQDRCIIDAIRLQEEVGLRAITDGEFRRAAWSTGLVRALVGLEDRPSLFEFHDSSGHRVRWDTCFAAAPIRRAREIALGEFEFVKRHTRATPKVTIPAPSFLHFFGLGECADRAVYPDLAEFWSDLIAIYQQELADLGRAGATYVQLDEVPQAMLCDDDIRARVRAHGEDPDALSRTYIDAVNRIVDARPPAMTIGMHLCRGNLRGHWMASGSYEAIAERLFNTLHVDGFFLEYDSERAGDFRPLRFMPAEKFVRLGIVSSKTAALESKDALRRRIDEAAEFVAFQRLGISPQCGFASTVGGNPLTIDDQRAKLALIVDLAHSLWGAA